MTGIALKNVQATLKSKTQRRALFAAPPRRGALIVNAVAAGKRPVVHHPTKANQLDPDLASQLRAEKVEKYLQGWKSDVDMSNRMNVMNALLLVAFGVPLLGLAMAFATHGTHWGGTLHLM